MVRGILVAAIALVLVTFGSFGLRPVHAEGVAQLGIKMSVTPTSASVGQSVTFTIVVTNHGPDGSTVYGIEMPPSTLTVTNIDCGPPPPFSSDGLNCEYTYVAPGTSRTMTITATINSGASGKIVNTACTTSPGNTTDPSAGNNCTDQKVKII